MKDITDADYTDAKRVCKDFERKHLGQHHGLYVTLYVMMHITVIHYC